MTGVLHNFTRKLEAMALLDLIDCCTKCKEQLLLAIQADADYATIQALDEHLSFLITSIRDLHLSAPSDINRQIKFFLFRSTNFEEDSLSSFDLDALNCLVDRYTDTTSNLPKFGHSENTVCAQADINLRNHRFRTDELIQEPNSRIALFNTDYIYEYCSAANARFNNASPEDMVGKHMAEIVGNQRFENRAKYYFDKCFGGESQKYTYFLDVPNHGEHLMNCQATPYRDDDGNVRGAFVLIEDLTDKLQRASQSAVSSSVA